MKPFVANFLTHVSPECKLLVFIVQIYTTTGILQCTRKDKCYTKKIRLIKAYISFLTFAEHREP